MKKILTFLLTALLAFSVGWAETTVTFEITNTGGGLLAGINSNNQTVSSGGITLAFSKGEGSSVPISNNGLIRFYAKNTLTISSTVGNITSIAFTYGSGYSGTDVSLVSGQSGTYDANTDTWTGSSTSVQFINNNSSQTRFYRVVVTVNNGGSTMETVETPSFSLPSGTYSGEQTVTITSATSGSTIYYTTDGIDPTTSSNSIENEGSVTISNTCTLKAIAAKNGMINSDVASADYVITTGGDKIYKKVTSAQLELDKKYILVYETTPAFMGAVTTTGTTYGLSVTGPSINNGQVNIAGYDGIKELTLSGSSSGWSFHNGDGYINWSSGNSLSISSSVSNSSKWTVYEVSGKGYVLKNVGQTDRVLQYNSSSPRFACYTGTQQAAVLYVEVSSTPVNPAAEAPTFDPASGASFYGSLDVTISSETSGATIYYTTDGSTPTTSSNSIASGGTVTINSSCTIKAIAVAQGHDNSTVAEATYTKETLPMPTFSPAGGTYDIGQSIQVSISAVDRAAIYYTLDGTDPVPSRTAYTGPITISENTTLKAIAVLNSETSETAIAEFVFAAPASTCDATIEFDNTATATITGTGYHVSAGSDIVTASQSSTAFEEAEGIRLGSGDHIGSLTLTLASDYNKVRKVVINAKRYGSDEGVVVNVATSNGETKSANIANESSYADYTFDNFSGNPVTTITISNSATRKRVHIKSVTIYYECAPVATLTAGPNPLNINDDNSTNGRNGSFTLSGQNLGNDNVGVNVLAGSGNFARWTSDQDWGFNNQGGSVNGTVYVRYNGNALSATGQVQAANNIVSTIVDVNYLYTGPIYVAGDVNNTYWNTNEGAQLTRDENGLYSGTITVQQSDGTAGYITFTKQLGSNFNDGRFGPISSGNWWLDGNEGVYVPIDTLGNKNNIRLVPGTYTVNVNPATNEFMITPYVITVTIDPANGTTFTGSTISGTITDNPAGTIEWSTDGNNWQTYDGGFTLTANQVGDYVTVYARSTSNGVTSTPVSATYQRVAAPAPEAPIFSRGSGDVARGTIITITAPEGTTLYVDGQQVTSPYDVTINHGTTISAYCVNDEGTHSTTVTNTYTIATICEAMIEFDTNGTQSLNGTGYKVTEESDYDAISGTSSTGYLSEIAAGIRFGSGSNAGSLTFTLDPTFADWNVTKIILNIQKYSNDNSVVVNVSTSNNESANNTLSGNDYANYDFNFPEGNEISSFTISNNGGNQRFNLKSITLVYSCGPAVEAPVITPATGTYYEDQTVTITGDSGTTIHYTTDGSEPTIDSPVYSGPFTAEYVANGTTTIKAIAVDEDDNVSEVSSATYTWATPRVTIHPDSRNTTASSVTVTLTGSPASAQVYYTTDGSTPTTSSTLYNGPFTVSLDEIGDQVTVNAIAVYGNLTSTMASATYTRVEKVIEVNAPFFSPLQNNTYYGDQTLLIGCTTPNADIYYEIVEVSGTTAPNAASVEDPTHASTYYDGTPIPMTVGNSYYVKAIAYIGNYVSTISEGWYTVVAAPTTQYTYANLKDFNDNCPTGVTAHFLNPVQVVYHSTYTNNGEFAEFCYLRDNTDYACVYFGKRDNNGYTIFKMGDWIDGSQIAGVTNIWERNFHIQLGTSSHQVTSWPTTAIGWSEILPEETTNAVIIAGDTQGDNSWGHYVHLRNTTLSNVADDSATDPKHKGTITDQSGDATYYDKFYRWSAGTCTYTTGGTTYRDVINHLGDYDQAFFDDKQQDGATFDVYGIVDYFSPDFQLCPIDFLWVYKPVMTPATTTSFEPVTVDITATHPEWAAEGVVIYYKTDDMEEWAVYTDPITVNSTTTIQAYAEVPSEKLDGTNYNDYVRSQIVSEIYTINGVVAPTISPASQVIEIVNGEESVSVTVTDHNEAGSSAVTTYTVNGVEYTLEAGQSVEIVVTETTTITAVSSIVTDDYTVSSNTVSETYTFVKKNGVIYDLLKTEPKVGNVYVIVNKKAYMGMSTTQNATNRGSVGVMFVENTNKEKVYGNDELAQFVLEKANADRYYFRNVNGDAAGYLVVMSNNFANLSTSAEATSYAEASVAIGGDNADVDLSYPATIAFTYDSSLRPLRYFANGRTFSTYSDASLNEDVFLYGVEATPLAYIEGNNKPGDQVTVSDQLIGTWAVNAVINGQTVKYLWAKDQGNVSIDKRPAKTQGQMDYVKDILKYEWQETWDESNWVILDFGEISTEPDDFVGHKIESATVKGTYDNNVNHLITLKEPPVLVNKTPRVMDVPGYPGWMSPFPGDKLGTNYDWDYNSYVPANIMTANHNHKDEEGKIVGFVADDGALPGLAGDSLYFVNPKIQEVAHLWAVWSHTDGEADIFTVYSPEHKENENINAWNLNGTFLVDWTYNRRSEQENDYGRPNNLTNNMAYEFHAAVMRRTNAGIRLAVEPQGTANPGTPSADYMLYPLDMSHSGTPTAVVEVSAQRTVVGVTYFNLMGVESKKPFEGINIVVTRYSDGSTSATKVLR